MIAYVAIGTIIGERRSRSPNTKGCELPERTPSDLRSRSSANGPGFYSLRDREIAGYPL